VLVQTHTLSIIGYVVLGARIIVITKCRAVLKTGTHEIPMIQVCLQCIFTYGDVVKVCRIAWRNVADSDLVGIGGCAENGEKHYN
jgi:hypothetical protein